MASFKWCWLWGWVSYPSKERLLWKMRESLQSKLLTVKAKLISDYRRISRADPFPPSFPDCILLTWLEIPIFFHPHLFDCFIPSFPCILSFVRSASVQFYLCQRGIWLYNAGRHAIRDATGRWLGSHLVWREQSVANSRNKKIIQAFVLSVLWKAKGNLRLFVFFAVSGEQLSKIGSIFRYDQSKSALVQTLSTELPSWCAACTGCSSQGPALGMR